MNKSRLNQIMQILLTPYKEKELLNADNDCLNNLRYLYFKIRNTDISQTIEKEKLESQYEAALVAMENFLKNSASMRISSIDDAKQLIELFFSEREIIHLLTNYDETCRKEAINGWYINNIFRIAESLLTFRDGKIAIRTWVNGEKANGRRDIFDYHDALNKAEIWNILSRMMVPDVFVAAFHVECGLTDKKYVYNQLGNVSLADKELDSVLKSGCAETHMHFNAGISHVTLWKDVTNPFVWEEKIRNRRHEDELQKDENYWMLHLIIYRIVMAEFLKHRRKESFCQYIETDYGTEFPEIVRMMHEFKEGQGYDADKTEQVFLELCGRWEAVYRNTDQEQDFLFRNVYPCDVALETTAEILFQIRVLEYIKCNGKDTHSMHLFMQYLRVKNIFFSKRVQSEDIKGVKNFQHYYSHATKTKDMDEHTYCKRMRAVFENQMQNTNLKKLEIRVVPQVSPVVNAKGVRNRYYDKEIENSILYAVKNILQEYIHCIEDYIGESINEDNLTQLDEQRDIAIPQIGVVFHFLKKDNLDNRLGNMCWLRQVRKTPSYNKHILAYRESMVRSAEAIERLRGEIPGLSEYIVGIDAASEELSVEPWVMAPVYNAIRNKSITKPVVHTGEGGYEKVQNIGFTYHVGEEFRHILSGLRYIDEVIERFGYKAADRIGHAIALGVDVDYWIESNEVVAMPINEYLENLVWLWGNIVYKGMRLPVSTEVIEGRILWLAQKIYQDIQGMTVFMLYQAYNDKFKCNHRKTFELLEKEIGESESDMPHFCSNYDTASDYVKKFWTKEKIICTYFCPVHWQRFREPILVSVKKEEADLFKAVQNQVIRKIEKMGIYVETNPTSNSVIGEVPGILEHPILNMNGRGLGMNEKNSVLVTINSDDPIVFNTNSENEIAYIYYMLLHKGFDKEHVLKWIEKIRKYGMDSSFIKGEKKPSQHVKEMKKLIEIIEHHLKYERTTRL